MIIWKVWKNLKTITKNSIVSYKVTGLKAGTKYKLRVKAYTKASGKTVWGKASAAKNVVTKAKAVTLKATNIAEKSVKFSWAKVKCHGYKLQQYTNKTWKTIKTLKNTATSVTVSDLKSNTSYKYRIVSYVTDSSKNKTWNTNSSACSITTKPTTTTKQTTKVTTTTTAEPVTTTTVTTTTAPKPTTKPVETKHEHTWKDVYVTNTIEHPAEYRTYWMASASFYHGDHPEYCPYDPNRLTPSKDPDGWWQRRTSYDLLCWYYGSLENVPEFNPEYDVLVGIKGTAESKAEKAYKKQFGVSFSAGSNNIINCYMPMARVLVKDAWTEEVSVVDHQECTGCDATRKV